MKLFKRLRWAYDQIRLFVIMIRTWYWTQKNADEIQRLSQEMDECDDCVLDEICEEHREQIEELGGGLHG